MIASESRYASAVSIAVTPRSSARWIVAAAVASSTAPMPPPIGQAPNVSRVTCGPSWPSCRYSTGCPPRLFPADPGPAGSPAASVAATARSFPPPHPLPVGRGSGGGGERPSRHRLPQPALDRAAPALGLGRRLETQRAPEVEPELARADVQLLGRVGGQRRADGVARRADEERPRRERGGDVGQVV